MGFADRDYVRNAPPPGRGGGVGGRGGWRTWSVTTWIMIICIGVFVIDGFLPGRYVPMSKVYWQTDSESTPSDWEYIPETQPRPFVVTEADGTEIQLRNAHPIRDAETRQVFGVVEVMPMHFLESYLHYSTMRGFLQFEFWRLIGFQFLHSHDFFGHLIFNMIGLYFFGPMVERYLSSKRFLAFYLLCGMAGALLYSMLNLGGFIAEQSLGIAQAPILLVGDIATPLIGASAGVFGVIMAGAFLAPNAKVLVFFVLPMRLVTMAYALVGISFFTLLVNGHNAGGEAGHLGGAIAGWYFIRRPHQLHNFFDIIGKADPTSHHYRKDAQKRRPLKQSRNAEQQKVDRILNKISEHGIHSLSEKEKRILRDASDDER